MSGAVLVVGGTGEARDLAGRLVDSGIGVLTSLAGAVARPRLPEGEVRIGGFGGPDGLRDWLVGHRPLAVVDASHPFAARISRSCVVACAATEVPLLRLERPAWAPGEGDRWHEVDDVREAAEVASRLGRSLLVTTGRRDLAPFAALTEVRVLARCVDPPTQPLPSHVEVLLDRGPYTVDGEQALMREHGVDVLVTKNSGGPLVAAKLRAARELGVAVVMIRRPAPAGAPTVPDVDAALAWVQGRLPDDVATSHRP
ncbi:cobalt-precorrin-6A reductase [Angustibacter luteus]|uniref:Cobalt-precorrin-6A reductase n=1 Tax=Angustibacter luteus TaxID=658456 RepID=A0ABW1JAW4_9ACTN